GPARVDEMALTFTVTGRGVFLRNAVDSQGDDLVHRSIVDGGNTVIKVWPMVTLIEDPSYEMTVCYEHQRFCRMVGGGSQPFLFGVDELEFVSAPASVLGQQQDITYRVVLPRRRRWSRVLGRLDRVSVHGNYDKRIDQDGRICLEWRRNLP